MYSTRCTHLNEEKTIQLVLVRTLFVFLMTVKKSATTMPEKNNGICRGGRTIFAVKPIRRQRDHPVVAAAGHELYQQHNYSYQISQGYRGLQGYRYNTTQTITPSTLAQ